MINCLVDDISDTDDWMIVCVRGKNVGIYMHTHEDGYEVFIKI